MSHNENKSESMLEKVEHFMIWWLKSPPKILKSIDKYALK